ncbi:hypothetical protein PFISCL1PPCAC_21852, partial [Pristionchus fissidentatus]
VSRRMASNGIAAAHTDDLGSQLESNGHGGEGGAVATLTQGEVDKLAKGVLDQVIGQNVYTYAESAAWNQLIVEQLTTQLVKTQRPYKFIVTSALLQTSNGSGLNVSSVSYWNKSTDLSFSFRWENKHMLAVVNVFAVAF